MSPLAAAFFLTLAAGRAAAMGDSLPPPGPVQLPADAERRATTDAAARPAPGSGPATGRPTGEIVAPAGTLAPAPMPLPAMLDPVEAAGVAPESLLFQSRVIVVFADTAADPAYLSQLALLRTDPAPLVLRDAVVLVDTDPAARSVWRERLRPRGFSLVVIDRQGQVIDRKPAPWNSREIARSIDKTPERRAETSAIRGGR